jgi:hypothetical protein
VECVFERKNRLLAYQKMENQKGKAGGRAGGRARTACLPPKEWAATEIFPVKFRVCWRKRETTRFISAATSSKMT